MQILLVSISAWFLAQSMKVVGELFFKKQFKPSLFFASGGMPSAHSAFMTAVSVQIGMESGFSSSVFALSTAITAIVVYDAYNVRRSVGLQGRALNEMIEYVYKDSDPKNIKNLKEVLGHTPLQVFCGILFGIFHVYFLDFIGLI